MADPKNTISFVTVLFLSFCVFRGEPANILFYTGRGDGSHYTTPTFLAEELVSRGHQVTFIISEDYRHRASHPVHSRIFGFEFVQGSDLSNEYAQLMSDAYKVAFERRNLFFERDLFSRAADMELRYCRQIFDGTMMGDLEGGGYDMVIFDPVVSPCAVALSEYFAEKRVVLIGTALMTGILREIGHPINPATTPEIGFGFPTNMDFSQRVLSFLFCGVNRYILPRLFSNVVYSEIFQRDGVSDHDTSLQNVDLVISSSDPLIDKIVPIFPGHVTAAGLTTRPSQPLSNEVLEDFMQSSGDDGVIIFSLGGYTTHLPEDIVISFRDAFAKLPQKIIWQWLNPSPLQDPPTNVLTLDWLPQNDLLGHTKTIMFIFHGGNSGMYEAIYHGVPLITVPIILDQFEVAQNVIEKEVGLTMDLSEVTEELVERRIKEVLENDKYRENIEHLSAMFRDRPLNPRATAAYWVEHVLKYGSDHLVVPGRDMSFIQYYSMDVIALIMICVALTVFLLYLVIKHIVNLCCTVCYQLVGLLNKSKAKEQ